MSSVCLLSAYTWQIEAAQQMLCLQCHQCLCCPQYMVALLMLWPHLQAQSPLFGHTCRSSLQFSATTAGPYSIVCYICRYSPQSFALLAGPVPNIWLHLQAQSPSTCQIQAAPVGPGQRMCTASTLHGCHKVISPTHHHRTPPPCPCLKMVCQAAEGSSCRSTLQECLSSATCCKAELQQRY